MKDVEILVDQCLAEIESVRPDLDPKVRQAQRLTLLNLSTRTDIYIRRGRHDHGNQRGSLLEWLVSSEPTFPQQTGQERSVATYLLSWMRGATPDELVIGTVGSKALVEAIVEIKHPGSLRAKQLQEFKTNLSRVVDRLQRRLRRDNLNVGSTAFPWPRETNQVGISRKLEKILYLPAGQPRNIDGWVVRESLFSADEVEKMVNCGLWQVLADRTRQVPREVNMAVRTPSSQTPVRTADKEKESMAAKAAQRTPAEPPCEVCGKGPQRKVLHPDGQREVYFFRNTVVEGKKVALKQDDECIDQSLAEVESNTTYWITEAIRETVSRLPDWDSATALKDAQAETERIKAEYAEPQLRLLEMYAHMRHRDIVNLTCGMFLNQENQKLAKGAQRKEVQEIQARINGLLRSVGQSVDEDQPVEAPTEKSNTGLLFVEIRELFDKLSASGKAAGSGNQTLTKRPPKQAATGRQANSASNIATRGSGPAKTRQPQPSRQALTFDTDDPSIRRYMARLARTRSSSAVNDQGNRGLQDVQQPPAGTDGVSVNSDLPTDARVAKPEVLLTGDQLKGCDQCGTPNRVVARFCKNPACLTPFPEDTLPTVDTASAPESEDEDEPIQDASSKALGGLDANAVVSNLDTEPDHSPEKTMVCGECGARQSKDRKFCRSCGKDPR